MIHHSAILTPHLSLSVSIVNNTTSTTLGSIPMLNHPTAQFQSVQIVQCPNNLSPSQQLWSQLNVGVRVTVYQVKARLEGAVTGTEG